jgi:hypothetical protein
VSYVGVVIEESLRERRVLERLRIVSTEVEPVTDAQGTPWLRPWTLHTVEIADDEAAVAASLLGYLKRFEEGELAERFGDAYLAYKRDVPFIIPRLPRRR